MKLTLRGLYALLLLLLLANPIQGGGTGGNEEEEDDEDVPMEADVGPNGYLVYESRSGDEDVVIENIDSNNNGGFKSYNLLTIESDDIEICDLDVRVKLRHRRVGQLTVGLLGPDGTTAALLFSGETCGSRRRIHNRRFSDEGDWGFCQAPNPNGPNMVPPLSPLNVFDGMSTTGDWILTIRDAAGPVDGELIYYRIIVLPCPPPPPTCEGSCMGDPHFKTWNGVWYDFHGECDLVFLHNLTFQNGLGMEIQIRTKGRGDFSFIESAAVRIGRDVLEVTGYGNYLLDGVSAASLPNWLSGYPITYSKGSDKKHTFAVDLGHGERIVIQAFKDLVAVKVEGATADNFGNSTGLMGEYGTGTWLARNGSIMAQDEPNAFGMEWQVQSHEETLFWATRFPQHPVQCILPSDNVNTKAGRRRLGETIAREAAAEACAHWGDQMEQCIYDVLQMNDLEIAEAGAF